MKPLFLLLFSCAAFALPLLAQPLPAEGGAVDDGVEVQFPNNPVQDVLDLYEQLTGKLLIRDANLSGVQLTITAPGKLPREEAIALIESSLLLNGYALIPGDDNTVKVLGSTKVARSESVQLYTSPIQLPTSEQVVSYFMPFRYLKSEEAKVLFEQYVQIRPILGGIVAVPSVNALVITENVALIRRLIDLKGVIDVQGSRSVTKFFTLTRADAELVAETLEKIFELDQQANPTTQQVQRVEGQQPTGQPDGVSPDGGGQTLVSALPARIKIIPDLRTNRVIVTAPENQMDYIREIVENLDEAVEFGEPLERALRFANAGEVLPVLANLLAEGEDDEQSSSGQDGGAGDNADSGSRGDNGDFSGGGVAGKPDLLSEPGDSTSPKSVVVGKSKIIADRAGNRIIVFGPPESRMKAATLLEMLDQRQKQIYLAVVIGQLTLGDGVNFGIDYLMRFGDVRVLGQGETAGIGNLLSNRTARVDLLPGTDAVTDVGGAVAAAAANALPVVSGLTVFGSIADSVDIFAQALGTSNRFKVISRPVVYTVNNKKAVISSGTQQPVPTSSLTSVVDSSVNNNGTAIQSNIEFKDVVLKLEVIPLVNSPDEVTLKIAQQNDNVVTNVSIGGNQVPVIATQELRTTVTVPNRHTVILGGLITDQDTFTQAGIPYLKDIPYVGALFGTTRKNTTRQELIVMIQPYIINNDADVDRVQRIERSNASFDEGSLYELPAPADIQRGTLPGGRYEDRYLEPVPEVFK